VVPPGVEGLPGIGAELLLLLHVGQGVARYQPAHARPDNGVLVGLPGGRVGSQARFQVVEQGFEHVGVVLYVVGAAVNVVIREAATRLPPPRFGKIQNNKVTLKVFHAF